jgi:hypothetical protein
MVIEDILILLLMKIVYETRALYCIFYFIAFYMELKRCKVFAEYHLKLLQIDISVYFIITVS